MMQPYNARRNPLGDYNGAWKELEKALEMGKVRAIGISDFDFNDELFESIVVPGSSNPAHIQENIESFSFTLSDDEMKQIAALNKEKRYFNMSYEQIKAWMGDYELWD